MVNWFTMVLFDVEIRLRHHWVKIVNLSTCQLVSIQIKLLQIRQFADIGRNRSYTKSRQNSEKREMVNWFTPLVFDVEIACI